MTLVAGRPTPLGGPSPAGGKPLGMAPSDFSGFSYNFSPGSYSFVPPVAGYWKFALWGGGFSTGAIADSGDSGAYAEITRFLTPAQTVTIVAGASTVTAGGSSTVTFPDGKVVTAGGATSSAGAGVGVASGGDLNINGAAGAAGAAPGGTAPSNGTFRGGSGGAGASGSPGQAPGGGGGPNVGIGGSGQVIALFVRP